MQDESPFRLEQKEGILIAIYYKGIDFMQNFSVIAGQNAIVIIIAITGLFGCLAFSLAGKGLAVLYNETISMTASNHPFIKQIKLRRENGMRINMNIHNTYAFVLKSMDRYKYLNLTIRDYMKVAWLIQLVCVMLGLVGGVINSNVWYTAYGCVCAVAVSCVGRIEDVEKKEQQVIINMVDYFDNVMTPDRKKEEAEHREIQAEEPEKEHCVKEPETVQTVTAINEEQRRLIEEVLREYLA